jgi:hypothetical protein
VSNFQCSESKEPTNLWGKLIKEALPLVIENPQRIVPGVGFNETTDSFLGNLLDFLKSVGSNPGLVPQQFHLQDQVKGGAGLSYLLINHRNKKFILFRNR